MRELKFRVWDNVDYMSSPFTLEDLMSKDIQYTSGLDVMQYTGLKDKNNKEIYEGDILSIEVFDEDSTLGDSKTYEGVVVFGQGNKRFVTDYPCSFTIKCKDFYKEEALLFNHHHLLEVVGHIYEK